MASIADFETIVGQGRVRTGMAGDAIDGVRPGLVIQPGTAEEVSGVAHRLGASKKSGLSQEVESFCFLGRPDTGHRVRQRARPVAMALLGVCGARRAGSHGPSARRDGGTSAEPPASRREPGTRVALVRCSGQGGTRPGRNGLFSNGLFR